MSIGPSIDVVINPAAATKATQSLVEWIPVVTALIGLAWPILIGFALFTFKKPIAALIDRINAIEGFGMRAEMAALAAKTEAVEAEVEAQPAPPPPPVDEAEVITSQGTFDDLVKVHPNSAALFAWSDVERLVRDLAQTKLEGSSAKGSVSQLVRHLMRSEVITISLGSLVLSLNGVRNSVVHGNLTMSPADARQFEYSTRLAVKELTRAIQLAKG